MGEERYRKALHVLSKHRFRRESSGSFLFLFYGMGPVPLPTFSTGESDMPEQRETLTWGGMPHSLELLETDEGLCGILNIVKPRGTQQIPVVFPKDVTLQEVMVCWKGKWEDLFPPVKPRDFLDLLCALIRHPFTKEGWRALFRRTTSRRFFAVIRAINLRKYRVLWYVFHVEDTPQDACMVLPKPIAA